MIAVIVLMVCQPASEAVLAFHGQFDLISAAFRLVFPLLVFAGSVRSVPAVPAGRAAAVSAAPASPALPDASAETDHPAEP